MKQLIVSHVHFASINLRLFLRMILLYLDFGMRPCLSVGLDILRLLLASGYLLFLIRYCALLRLGLNWIRSGRRVLIVTTCLVHLVYENGHRTVFIEWLWLVLVLDYFLYVLHAFSLAQDLGILVHVLVGDLAQSILRLGIGSRLVIG